MVETGPRTTGRGPQRLVLEEEVTLLELDLAVEADHHINPRVAVDVDQNDAPSAANVEPHLSGCSAKRVRPNEMKRRVG